MVPVPMKISVFVLICVILIVAGLGVDLLLFYYGITHNIIGLSTAIALCGGLFWAITPKED